MVRCLTFLDRKIAIRAHAHIVYKVICQLLWQVIRNLLRNSEFCYNLIIQFGDGRSRERQWQVHTSRYIHRLDGTHDQWASRSNLELYLNCFARFIIEVE